MSVVLCETQWGVPNGRPTAIQWAGEHVSDRVLIPHFYVCPQDEPADSPCDASATTTSNAPPRPLIRPRPDRVAQCRHNAVASDISTVSLRYWVGSTQLAFRYDAGSMVIRF